MTKQIVAALVVVWISVSAVLTQSRPPVAADARFDALASLIDAKMREHGVPGVAFGIVEGDKVTIRGFGVTSVENPTPVTDHTVFPIASISKTFAATAAMRLVEQGKLDLRAPVRTYLPDFRVQDEAVSRDVTISHLLTHTSGWEGQVSGPERGDATLANFMTTITDLMQLAPPGAAWSYNNAGFSVLGRVIEVVTGTSINRAMRDLVFTPVGLPHAGTTAGEFITFPFALGHGSRGGAPPTLQRPFSPSVSVTAGGVGVCMTDLLAYARFHLGNGASSKGEKVLTQESLARMREPQLRKQGTDDDMGLGWHLRTIGDVRVAAHGGTLGGHILLLELVPQRNFAIAILTNASSGWRLIQDVERAALKSYLNASFSTNQALSHRGLVETLPDARPMERQPDFKPYIGEYKRPMNSVVVREENGRLMVQTVSRTGNAQAAMPVSFYGLDRAMVGDGADRGQSIEFVRDAAGNVKWIRVTGRIAVHVAKD
jgi:CubicO group peptidase (beta-lactamase class C family)